MPRWQRMYLVVCAAVIGFAATYAVAVYSDWPLLTYFPLEREWKLASGSIGPVPSPYLGIVLWGACGGLVAAALAAVATRIFDRPVPERWLRLSGAWALTAFAFAGAFFTWSLLAAA